MDAIYNGYRVFMPYCIKGLGGGRYIVLNRDSKPLGVPSCVDVDLSTHPSALPMKITAEHAMAMSVHQDPNIECIYLLKGDGPPKGADLIAYADRLAVLMSISVTAQRPYRMPPGSSPK